MSGARAADPWGPKALGECCGVRHVLAHRSHLV
jgi:hypothetical protein